MNWLKHFGLIALFTVATSTTAADIAIEETRIENCLRFSPDKYSCIGLASGTCSNLPAGHKPEGLLNCVQLEREFWQGKQERALAQLKQRAAVLDPQGDLWRGILGAHNAWLPYRDAFCKATTHKLVDAQLRANYCLMRHDGEEALYLDWLFSDRLGTGK